MLFLELWFWVFTAIAVPVFWACPPRLKLPWLAVASAVFHYHFAGAVGMLPAIAAGVLAYAVGLRLHPPRGRALFLATCGILVGALVAYKYAGLLARTSGAIASGAGFDVPPGLATWQGLAIPLGISFFTFEFVHYLYEVWVGGREPVRRPLHFTVFAIFFPSLAAGPIKRFPDFVPQLDTLETPAAAEIAAGARRVLRGLFKKVCIADLLVEYVTALEAVPHHTIATVGALAVTQGFRIYYDFAGYTDIAIGLAKLVGIRLPENFDRPYWSTSLQDFWRRWHMSLSSWIRDYVYIPLGGNRRRQALNVLTAMALCGLWHGPAWHFALWGLYHGGGLALEGGLRRARPRLFEPHPVSTAIRWAACYGFVTFGWLLFFYPTVEVARMTKEALWGSD